jgi:hypothetical protein
MSMWWSVQRYELNMVECAIRSAADALLCTLKIHKDSG